jgi:hypothetical protein
MSYPVLFAVAVLLNVAAHEAAVIGIGISFESKASPTRYTRDGWRPVCTCSGHQPWERAVDVHTQTDRDVHVQNAPSFAEHVARCVGREHARLQGEAGPALALDPGLLVLGHLEPETRDARAADDGARAREAVPQRGVVRERRADVAELAPRRERDGAVLARLAGLVGPEEADRRVAARVQVPELSRAGG